MAVSKIYVSQMRKLTKDVRTEDSRVQSALQETIQHRMLIKTLEGEDMMIDRLEHSQSILRHKVVRRTSLFRLQQHRIEHGLCRWLSRGLPLGRCAYGFPLTDLWWHDGFLAVGQPHPGNPARSLTKLVPAFVSVFTAAERLMELEENPLDEQGEARRHGASLRHPL